MNYLTCKGLGGDADKPEMRIDSNPSVDHAPMNEKYGLNCTFERVSTVASGALFAISNMAACR